MKAVAVAAVAVAVAVAVAAAAVPVTCPGATAAGDITLDEECKIANGIWTCVVSFVR